MTANGVYVYAIIRKRRQLLDALGGVGSPPASLRTITQGPVAAVVSEAPAQLRARRRDLLAHQELLMRLADDGPVLPMRFGMVAPDDETVRRQLAASEARHLAALGLLVDRVEVNVKAFPAQDALGALVAQDRTIRRLRDEARRRPGYDANLRLGEAVAAALTRRAVEAGQGALRRLTPMACAVTAGPEVQGCALNVSFLLDRSGHARFAAAAREFADAHSEHVELRIAGPLPCYSFVADDALPAETAGV